MLIATSFTLSAFRSTVPLGKASYIRFEARNTDRGPIGQDFARWWQLCVHNIHDFHLQRRIPKPKKPAIKAQNGDDGNGPNLGSNLHLAIHLIGE